MERHTHHYKRVKIGKTKRVEFKCALPGCPHHIPKELAEGRESICPRCDATFVLNKKNMRLAIPHCDACYEIKGPRKSIVNKLEELFK